MGAGISSDIQKHLLESWQSKKAAPPALEKEVRGFLQRARDLLEVYLAPHAPDVAGAPPKGAARRPEWLEPQQLHIALVGRDQLVEAFLASLAEVAPLLEVVAEQGGTEPEEEEDGSEGLRALDKAAKAGFRCYAIIDEDLHLLRFWALGEGALPPDGKLAIPGLPYLDLVVLLVKPGAEQAAVGSQAERQPPKPKVGGAEAAAQKQAQQRVALEAELASLRARLAALPPPPKPSAAAAAAAPAAGDGERGAVEAEFKRALSELAALGGGGGGGGGELASLEVELKAVRAKKQALIEDEDYDGAHAAKQEEKELAARMEEARQAQERRQALEDRVRELEAKLRALGPGATEDSAEAGAEERLDLEEELKEVQALKRALIEAEDYDGAHDAKQREKELLAQLEELKTRGSGGDDGRASLEEELNKVRAQKQALIEAEDYDGAHEAKQREKELLAQLENLPKPRGGGSDSERAALEEQLKQVRAKKQELIEAEEYEAAHEAKQEEKALLAKLEELKKGGGGDGGRAALEEELKQVRAKKQALIEAEDYDAAHEAKQREKELLAQLEGLEKTPSGDGGGAAAALQQQRAELEKQLQEARARKKSLIEAEDYDGAHEAKQQEKELLAKLESLKMPEDGAGAGERRAAEQELREVLALKQALKEAEDYDGALEAKWQELELRARLELLGARKTTSGRTAALEKELREVQARKRALLQAEDYDGAYDAKQRETKLKAEIESSASQDKPAKPKPGEPQDDENRFERRSLEEEINRIEGQLEEMERKRAEEEQKAEALQEELALVRAEKKELIEAEDFDGAHEAKQREKELLAELASLGASSAGEPEEPKQGKGAKDAGSAEAWAEKVGPLAGDGKPPVLVASCGAAPAELQKAAGAKLKASEVIEIADLEQRRCQAGRFWDAMRAGLRMVEKSRALPEYPQHDLGGGYSLGDWIFVKDEGHALDGTYGVLVGFEDDGSWDFKVTVRLVDGQILTLRQDQINPLATEVKFDVSSVVELKKMDLMWVRLKDLKGRADLNDMEGYASTYSVQKREEGYESIYDCPARHEVTLEDGTDIRVKTANFDIYEKERPELQDMPGLVDRLHLDGERYSVLVVRQGERGPVTIDGLAKRPELNGQRGTVVDFDEDTERFTIRTDVGSSEVSIKRANLQFDVPRTVAQRLYLRPMCVEEFQGRPDKPEPKKKSKNQIDEQRDEEVIGAALDRSRRARGEL